MKLALLTPLLTIWAYTNMTTPALAAGSTPDLAQQYYQRSNCHGAYDLLVERGAKGGTVAQEERSWALRHEDAGSAGNPCPAVPAELAKAAAGRTVSTPDGLARMDQFLKRGDAVAIFEGGWAVLSGKLPSISRDIGVGLIRKAAELGDPTAQFIVASGFISGAFGATDYKAALPLVEAAAQAGHVDALFMAGNFYKDGIGGSTDKKKAFDYYRQAAERGHTYAAILGFYMIQDGEGTAKDFSLAYRLARNIADEGWAIGAVLCASALLQQSNRVANEDEVMYWLGVASRDGDAATRTAVDKLRPAVAAAYTRAKTPPAAYVPPVRKACPLKTTCLVDRRSGMRSCTTNKDYWSDCDF